MTRKELLDEARRLIYDSARWYDLFDQADPDTREELQRMHLAQYRREEYRAGMA